MDIPKPAKQTPEEEARLHALEARVAEIERENPEGRLVGRDPIDRVPMKKRDREELRRRRYTREEEHRRWVEAELAKLNQLGLKGEERENCLDELGIWVLPAGMFQPDEEFFHRRLDELGGRIKDLDMLLRIVLGELMDTDIPLGPHIRAWVKFVLLPDPSIDREATRMVAEDALKEHLIKNVGMEATKANEEVAACQNITWSAIKKRRREWRRRRGSK